MRLTILGKGYPPAHGGIETHVQDLARAMSPHHEVSVVVHAGATHTTRETADGALIIRSGVVASPLNQPISLDMRRLVIRSQPDVVHVHAPNIWASLVALTLPRLMPIVVTHHADIIGREPVRSMAMIIYRALIRRAAAVIVTQPNNAEFSDDLPAATPVQVIPYCVDTAKFTGDASIVAEAQELRDQLGPARSLAVFVGRLVPYKGADVMIEALADTPDLTIAIIGGGPLRQPLEAKTHALGLSDRVVFVGDCDERTKHIYLAASDFLILPSVTTAEAFGIVQVEAMLWEKPVLTTSLLSGVPQVGVPEETSIVVPPRDIPALVQSMRRLAGDKALRQRLGRAGKARGGALYNKEKFTGVFLDVYAAATVTRNATRDRTSFAGLK